MRLIMRLLAAKWRRGRDSFSPEGSVRVGSDLPPAGHSLPTRSNPTIKKPSHTRGMIRLLWRRLRDSNPRGLSPKRFSRPPRCDRFDKPPYEIFRQSDKMNFGDKQEKGQPRFPSVREISLLCRLALSSFVRCEDMI